MPDAIARRLDSLIGPERSRTLLQFLRFGVVGTVGFVVDSAVLYAGLALGLGLYGGRAAFHSRGRDAPGLTPADPAASCAARPGSLPGQRGPACRTPSPAAWTA